MPPKAKKGKKVRYSRWLVTVNPLKPKLGSYPGGERGLRTKLEACARLLRPPRPLRLKKSRCPTSPTPL